LLEAFVKEARPSLGARPDLAVTDNEATPGQHHTMR